MPVDWVDDPDSRVDVVRTATDDLKGVVRMIRRFAHGEGVVSLPTSDRATPRRQAVRQQHLRHQLVRAGLLAGAALIVSLAARRS